MIASLLLLPLLSPVQAGAAAEPVRLELVHKDGDTLCTLRARGVRVDDLVAQLARADGRLLEGLPFGSGPELVDADLERRPFAHVVQVVLGSAGRRARLSPERIEVLGEPGVGEDPGQFEELAELAWRRAMRAFPAHPVATRGELELAQLQERRGNLGQARVHWDNIARNHPSSELVPLALLRAGLLLQRQGEWTEASSRFSSLANLTREHEYHGRARLELARCFARRGDGRQALSLLDALEGLFPLPAPRDQLERLYVRAQALAAAGRHAEALNVLNDAGRFSVERAQEQDALELRAEALEHVGLPGDAGRAWLAWSVKASGRAYDQALFDAARLALADGDPAGVLFVQRRAAGTGVEQAIEPLAARAREQLGMALVSIESDAGDRIARARELLALGSLRQALVALEALFRGSAALTEEQALEVALAYARALESERGLESALGTLRTAARQLRNLDSRRQVYLLAGELCERHEQWQRAAEAYGGRL